MAGCRHPPGAHTRRPFSRTARCAPHFRALFQTPYKDAYKRAFARLFYLRGHALSVREYAQCRLFAISHTRLLFRLNRSTQVYKSTKIGESGLWRYKETQRFNNFNSENVQKMGMRMRACRGCVRGMDIYTAVIGFSMPLSFGMASEQDSL